MEMLFLNDNMKSYLRQNIQQKLKKNDWMCMILGLVGTSFACIASEQYFWADPDSGKFQKAKETLDPHESLRTSGQFKMMIVECIVCGLHSPPGINAEIKVPQQDVEIPYSLDMVLTLITLFRFYLMWRVFARYSYWNDEKAEKICHECHTFGGTSFAIKCELKERPYTILLVTILGSIFIFGYAIRAAEMPYQEQAGNGQDWRYIWNGMWCIIITMATVGYGDFYPSTHIGRCVGVFACLWGNFIISIMVVSLTFSSEFTPQQRKAYDLINQELGVYENNKNAINVIQSAIKYRLFMKKNLRPNKKVQNKLLNKFKEAVRKFQKHRKDLLSMEQEIPRESLLVKLNQKMTQEFDKILTDARGIKKTLLKLEEAEKNQEEIEELIENTLSLGNQIMDKIEDFKQKSQNPALINAGDEEDQEDNDKGGNDYGGGGNTSKMSGFERKLQNKLNSMNQESFRSSNY
eukprot:403366439